VINGYKTAIVIVLIFFFLLTTGQLNGATVTVGDNGGKLTVEYYKDKLYLSLDSDDIHDDIELKCRNINFSKDEIDLADMVQFIPDEIIWDDNSIAYERLKIIDLEKISKGRVKIEFKIKNTPSKSRRPSNIINSFEPIDISEDRFVRGDVINIGSDIDIYGEVSKNIVCFFGDITLHSKSVVRGDVIAICGRVYRHDDSQVYGQIISSKGWQKGGRRFGSRRGYYRPHSLNAGMEYNRVDGYLAKTWFKYEDPDQFFPTIELGIGYAFEAKRLHYNMAFSQRFMDKYAIEPHGRVYRETGTEDDWVCGEDENTVFALIVNEDFRDYYEREGSEVGLRFHLGKDNSIDFQYSYDNLDWMESHTKLWSLFGKKDFRENFSTLPYELKETYKDDFTGKLSLFKINYTLDTDGGKYLSDASWFGQIQYEKAGGDLKGDLTYTKWMVSLSRYQPFNRYFALNLRAMYGGSSDRLPLFKKYFLGGLRTLRGYKHKVFYGDQMFLANAEYIFELSYSFRTTLFFDIGKVIGQDDDLWDDGEFKSDIGIGFGFSPDFRVELAKALDKSDSDIKIWVTFAKSF
jgi:Omp85 superfamily domain